MSGIKNSFRANFKVSGEPSWLCTFTFLPENEANISSTAFLIF